MTSQFADMTSSSKFFDVGLFFFSGLVTGPNFISISSLALKLWQFIFIRYWPEIRKSEIPSSEFCSIYGDWGKLGIPNLERVSLMKCYLILQNARDTAFTVSELLRENQQGGSKITPPAPSRAHTLTHTPRLGLMLYHMRIKYLQITDSERITIFLLNPNVLSPGHVLQICFHHVLQEFFKC